MKRTSPLLLVLGIASVSFSSCSRSNYVFSPNTPAYLGSTRVPASAVAATEAVAEAAAPEAASPVTEIAPARQAAQALAHPIAAAPTANKTGAAATLVAASVKVPVTKQEQKALKREVRRQIAVAPKDTKAGGKSQLVALILSFFLGGLGIHRFYLGYIGIGILELLTGGVFGILALIDFIRIIIGTLKPKNGEYAKTL